MDFKELLKNTVNSFFIIFSSSVLVAFILFNFFRFTAFEMRYISAILLISVLISLANFIFYSKKELKKATSESASHSSMSNSRDFFVCCDLYEMDKLASAVVNRHLSSDVCFRLFDCSCHGILPNKTGC